MKKFTLKKVIITLLLGIILITSGKYVSAGVHFQDGTHYWSTRIMVLGSESEYWHRTKQHSATVTKGSKINSQSKSANSIALARLFEFSGCNFYYNNW